MNPSEQPWGKSKPPDHVSRETKQTVSTGRAVELKEQYLAQEDTVVFKKSNTEWIHSLETREPAGKLKAGSDPKLLKSALKSIKCMLLILQCSDVKKRYYPGGEGNHS